jgi:uncharacterized protein YndB with AHSA1/START domain
MSTIAKPHERTVNLTRIFDAPRERVFECWTRAEHLVHWFGPKGFTIHSCETDPRPGGVFRLTLRAPDGRDFRVRGEFREVLAPSRLVIVCAAEDDKGIERLQELIDVTFTQAEGRTKVVLSASARGPSEEAAAMIKGMDKGWTQTVERLDAHLRK